MDDGEAITWNSGDAVIYSENSSGKLFFQVGSNEPLRLSETGVDLERGFINQPEVLTAKTAGENITGYHNVVAVTAVEASANDFITLPTISTVPFGHEIKILCLAGSNFELRTPALSGNTINGVDSDGTNEYLCTDTDTIIVTKSSLLGWIAQSYTALGALRTAVVPD
jgi:hypothetical protein